MENVSTDNLFKALGLFIESIREYVVAKLLEEAGDKWPVWYREALYPSQQEDWDKGLRNNTPAKNLIDFHNLKGFAIKYKALLKSDFKRDVGNLPSWFDQIAQVRHSTTHFGDVKPEDVLLVSLHIDKILGILQLEEERAAIADLIANSSPSEKKEPKKKRPSAIKSGDLIPWFRNVKPHLDIRQGHLDESIFAANLAEVALGSGREVYQNPALFFSKTYFTLNLKNVAKRVIQGLNGQEDGENRVMSLQTGFGGGKTHTLITLFHLASWGNRSARSAELSDLVDFTGIPDFKTAKIAVFTNTTNDPTQGREVEGVHIRTIWGEIAWQLGGIEAYELIRSNDENRTAPKGLFKKVLDRCRPGLILIDELADYCVAASGIPVGASSLSDQTVSFMQELTEAVASTERIVMVATLPASVAEVANSEKAAKILHSLEQRISRVGADTKPVSDEEIFQVIRRRLFEDLGEEDAMESCISQYMQMYQELSAEFPDFASRSKYKEVLRKSYPFHPELIDIFRVRWASNSDFQRTRGVLRLLASIVADLWKRKESLIGANGLIHPTNVRFENLDALSGQLKKLYGNGYDAVITADVAGSSSNASKLDEEKPEYGQYQLTQGVASTILMASFGSTGANQGISTEEIKLCAMKPMAFNHNSINGTLTALEGNAHYLHYSTVGRNKRYWFHTKPNLNILVNQARTDIGRPEVEKEILAHLEQGKKRIQNFEVLVAPTGDITEQRRSTLVIMHPKYQLNGGSIPKAMETRIEQIATKKGNSDRLYRNTILFLACSELSYSTLKDKITEYLACKKIQEEYFTQFEKEQKDDLKKKIEGFSSTIARDIATCYSIILKYGSANRNIQRLDLRLHKDTLAEQVNTVMVDFLKDEEWIIPSVGMGLLRRNNLVPSEENSIQATKVLESFLRYDDKPMITSSRAVQDSLLKYCYEGEFAIASGSPGNFTQYYYKDKRPSFFDVEDDNYWLVHPKVYHSAIQEERSPVDYSPIDQENATVTVHEPEPGYSGRQDLPATVDKEFSYLKISGKVAVEHWTNLFSSFVRPLIDNDIEIHIEIKAKSKKSAPLNESSQAYKIVKESASQLGLDFEEG